MEIGAIIAILQTMITELPGAITTVEQLVSLGEKFFSTVNGKDPTEDEKAQLRAQIDTDVAAALEPLPPAQAGDPDFGQS